MLRPLLLSVLRPGHAPQALPCPVGTAGANTTIHITSAAGGGQGIFEILKLGVHAPCQLLAVRGLIALQSVQEMGFPASVVVRSAPSLRMRQGERVELGHETRTGETMCATHPTPNRDTPTYGQLVGSAC